MALETALFSLTPTGQGAQRQDCDEAEAGKRESVLREASETYTGNKKTTRRIQW